MLPDPNNFPPRLRESFLGVGVALAHTSYLFAPPSVVRTRYRPVKGAAMPKTPIYENRDAGAGENDVRFASQAE
jgi:hypothetical protein